MKRLLVCILLGLFLVTGCGDSTEPDLESTTEKSEITENPGIDKNEITKTPGIEENDAVSSETDAPAVTEEDDVEEAVVNTIQLYKDYLIFEERGEMDVVCRSKRDVIKIFGNEIDKYPKLKDVLEDISEKTVEQMTLFMSENADYALEEEGNEYFSGYNDESEMYVQRADDVIVSIRESQYQYMGGAHPMSAYGGINIDPVAGELLTVNDVFPDSSKLVEVLSNKLIEKYGEDVFYTSPEELLNEYEPEMFSWTVGYQGITFYFSPYELAPYAAGTQYVTIWFDEAKEWIDEKYMSAPSGGYVSELPLYEEFHLDFDAEDKEKEVLTVGQNFVGDDGDSFQLSVCINDTVCFSEETFYYGDLKTSLACIPEQGKDRYYLYVEYSIESTDLYVYELTEEGIHLQGILENVRMPGVVLEEWDSYNQTQMYMEPVLTDPSEFIMVSRMYLMGIMDGVKTYHADPKDGLPKADTDYYILPEDVAELTLKINLEVEILPGNDVEVIKEGTKFYYLHTDNETYMDFRMDDGRACRVYFEEKDWDKTINGFLPDECFEGIPNYF